MVNNHITHEDFFFFFFQDSVFGQRVTVASTSQKFCHKCALKLCDKPAICRC